MTYHLTERQEAARKILSGSETNIMLDGGGRCVAGDTILDGTGKRIDQLIGQPVWVETTRGKLLAGAPFLKGKCKLLRFVLSDGKSVEVTPDHRFWDGTQWITANRLLVGSSLAVQLSSPFLLESSSEHDLSKSRANGLHSMQKLSGYLGDCFRFFHQYGQRLLENLSVFLVSGASQSCVLGHSHLNQCLPFHAFESPVSNIHIHLPSEHAGEYIRSDHELFHPSNMGDSPFSYREDQYGYAVSGKTSALSLGLHLINRLFDWLWILPKSFAEAFHGGAYRFCRFFGLSYDTPCSSQYATSRVVSITETAEKEYYTLHVPVCEQYFGNGILHHNSGKTFIICRQIVIRALKAPGSRHVALRFRFNHAKTSIGMDTFPKVMLLAFPNIPYKLDKQDWVFKFENGSEFWIGGLDDKERTEKILGHEYATIFLSECSQISYDASETAKTRLAQKVKQIATNKELSELVPRMYYDQNPPSMGHWTYKVFYEHKDPVSGKQLPDQSNYAVCTLNPRDNEENLTSEYLRILQSLSARKKKRFLDGEYADDGDNMLFSDIHVETWRVLDGKVPDLIRVIVGIDPSGSGDIDNADNDEIGIVVGGLGSDGIAYLLEDCSIKAGPGTWGKVATLAFERHEANMIVGEGNYGGAMVEYVIQTARPKTPFKLVNATRGKSVRAEPFAALYEQGKIKHSGQFQELEDELYQMGIYGYLGRGSPNRVDAWIWVLTELFGGIVKERKLPPRSSTGERHGTTFMGE